MIAASALTTFFFFFFPRLLLVPFVEKTAAGCRQVRPTLCGKCSVHRLKCEKLYACLCSRGSYSWALSPTFALPQRGIIHFTDSSHIHNNNNKMILTALLSAIIETISSPFHATFKKIYSSTGSIVSKMEKSPRLCCCRYCLLACLPGSFTIGSYVAEGPIFRRIPFSCWIWRRHPPSVNPSTRALASFHFLPLSPWWFPTYRQRHSRSIIKVSHACQYVIIWSEIDTDTRRLPLTAPRRHSILPYQHQRMVRDCSRSLEILLFKIYDAPKPSPDQIPFPLLHHHHKNISLDHQ